MTCPKPYRGARGMYQGPSRAQPVPFLPPTPAVGRCLHRHREKEDEVKDVLKLPVGPPCSPKPLFGGNLVALVKLTLTALCLELMPGLLGSGQASSFPPRLSDPFGLR